MNKKTSILDFDNISFQKYIDGLGLTLLISIIFLLPFLLSFVLFFESTRFLDYFSQNIGFMFIQALSLVGATVFYLLASGWWVEIKNDLKLLSKSEIKKVIYLIGSVLIGLSIVFYFNLNNSTAQSGFNLVGTFFLSTVGIIMVTSITEEIIFRGIFQKKLRKITDKTYIRVIYPNIIFAIFHIPSLGGFKIEQIISLFILGCVFGYVYEEEKNLLLPMLLHALYNLVILTSFSGAI